MIKELEDIFEKYEKFKEKNYQENKSKTFDIVMNNIQKKELNKNESSGSASIYQNYVSFEKKLVYLLISKCASSSIGEYLSTRKDFTPIGDDIAIAQFHDKYPNERVENYNFFTVIRDPKSRWISGLNEFLMVHKGHVSKLKIYIEKELKNNKFIFDLHTLPQIDCLSYVIDLPLISNIIFLKLGENLNQKISSLLGEDIKLNYSNAASSDSNKRNNLNFCREMFETHCEKNPKYYQTYEFDYRLFNLSE